MSESNGATSAPPTNGAEPPSADKPSTNGSSPSTDQPPPPVKPAAAASGIPAPGASKIGGVRSIPKPSGIKPPTLMSSMSLSSSTTSLASTSSAAPVTATASRIGRPCMGHHAPKAGPPPQESKNEVTFSSPIVLNRRRRCGGDCELFATHKPPQQQRERIAPRPRSSSSLPPSARTTIQFHFGQQPVNKRNPA
nr:COPII coat assembly protein sec16-like [Aedes albopictus]